MLVFKLALVLESATNHLLILHLLLEVFKRQAGSHHLIDAAANSPPVHRHAVVLLPQDLWSHVASCTSLTTRTQRVEYLKDSSKKLYFKVCTGYIHGLMDNDDLPPHLFIVLFNLLRDYRY